MGITSLRKYLDQIECRTLPTDCVIEAPGLYVSCNNSVFNNTNNCKLTVQLNELICLVFIQTYYGLPWQQSITLFPQFHNLEKIS